MGDALLAEIGIGAVGEEPAEEGQVVHDFGEQDGAVESWGVGGPAVLGEELEELELLV